jgi:hypothetical protein
VIQYQFNNVENDCEVSTDISVLNSFRVTYKNPESDVSYFIFVFFKLHVMSLCILLYKPCHYFSDIIYLVEKLPLKKYEVSVTNLKINIHRHPHWSHKIRSLRIYKSSLDLPRTHFMIMEFSNMNIPWLRRIAVMACFLIQSIVIYIFICFYNNLDFRNIKLCVLCSFLFNKFDQTFYPI